MSEIDPEQMMKIAEDVVEYAPPPVPSKKSAYLSIVTPGNIQAETVMSLCQTLRSNGPINWNFGYGSESLVERARNMQAEFFFNYQPKDVIGDVILFVDADITWNQGDAEHVVEKCYETRSIVGGLYTSRWDFDIFLTTRFLEPNVMVNFGADEMMEVEMVSGGFMAIHRDVLEALAPKVDYFKNYKKHPNGSFHRWFACDIVPIGDDRNLFLSEDWYLCYKAREAGFKVYADCKPILGHIGVRKYGATDLPGVKKI